MKKILLTGGKGFFSKRLASFYHDDYEWVITDKEELDITDRQSVFAFLEELRPDYVIHAAAIAVTDFCNQHPEIAHRINVQGAVNVAEAAKKVSAKMVFLSTEQVFNGNREPGPYREDDLAQPDTVYGQNKLEAEGHLKQILDELWIIRFTWMFGFPERQQSMVNNLFWDTIVSVLNDEPISASKREFRGMTYVYDMISQFEKVFTLPYGIYHFGSENTMSRYEAVEYLLETMGLGDCVASLLIEDKEKYQELPRDIRLDASKAKKFGVSFLSTQQAMRLAIEDYGLVINKNKAGGKYGITH